MAPLIIRAKSRYGTWYGDRAEAILSDLYAACPEHRRMIRRFRAGLTQGIGLASVAITAPYEFDLIPDPREAAIEEIANRVRRSYCSYADAKQWVAEVYDAGAAGQPFTGHKLLPRELAVDAWSTGRKHIPISTKERL